MSVADILEELDQDEASNDIRVDDLEVDASHTHTNSFTQNRMESSSQSRRKRAKSDDMGLIDVMTRTCNVTPQIRGFR